MRQTHVAGDKAFLDYSGKKVPILLGIALLVAEAFIGTFGALGAGRIIAFLFGSIMMFHGNAPGFGLSLSVVLAAIMVSAGVLLLGLALLLRSRRRPIITGGEAMIRDARQRHRPQGASSHSKAERQSR
jgi:membrane-bound serine protease (ClpP class)